MGPLRQQGGADRVLGHPAQQALLYRPLPLNVGRCTSIIIREKATGARGVALYSLYTNVS